MDDITGMIGQYGFPIVAYLLMYLRLEKKVDKLIEVIAASNQRKAAE